MTEQLRDGQKCLEKDRWFYEEHKEKLQKWLVIDTRHCLKKKKKRVS